MDFGQSLICVFRYILSTAGDLWNFYEFLSQVSPGETFLPGKSGIHQAGAFGAFASSLSLELLRCSIRLAIQHGVPLLPVYSFGENQLFRTGVVNGDPST